MIAIYYLINYLPKASTLIEKKRLFHLQEAGISV